MLQLVSGRASSLDLIPSKLAGFTIRASPTVLPWKDAGPALMGAVTSEGQGQLSQVTQVSKGKEDGAWGHHLQAPSILLSVNS